MSACASASPYAPLSTSVSPAKPTRAPEPEPSPAAHAVPVRFNGCSDAIDAAELLARHAEQFGAMESLERRMPVSLTYAFEESGEKGDYIIDLARDRWREQERIAGSTRANGSEGLGRWMLRSAGVVVRLRPGRESIDLAFDEWTLRRRYLATTPSWARCDRSKGRELVTLAYEQAEIGSPRLVFERESGALERMAHTGPDGQFFLSKPVRWSEPDGDGMRWPESATADGASTAPARLVRIAPGPACGAVDRPPTDCLSPPPASFVARWPSGGRVRLPFVFVRGELLVRATVAGRDVWAMIDSGATVSHVRRDSVAARAMRGKHPTVASAVAQVVQMEQGSLNSVKLGDLTLEQLPVAAVEAANFAQLGDMEPEIVIGIGLFAVGTVRINFAEKVIDLAPEGQDIARSGGIELPFEIIRNGLRAKGVVEGRPAELGLDTGSAAAFVLHRSWLDGSTLSDGRPSTAFDAHFGLGGHLERTTTLSLHSAELGPIRERDRIAYVVDPPLEGRAPDSWATRSSRAAVRFSSITNVARSGSSRPARRVADLSQS